MTDRAPGWQARRAMKRIRRERAKEAKQQRSNPQPAASVVAADPHTEPDTLAMVLAMEDRAQQLEADAEAIRRAIRVLGTPRAK